MDEKMVKLKLYTPEKNLRIKMKRREFIKTLGFGSIGLYLLPSLIANNTNSFSPDKSDFIPPVNWLYGSPQKGCSTSLLSSEFHGKLENGLDDWANFRFRA
jgi:Ni,Fe-hydrogenase I small subunit